MSSSDKRLCVIAVIVENKDNTSPEINKILNAYGHLFIGRMGIPHKDRGIGLMSLMMEASTDDIGAVTGKLGNIAGVKVKSLTV